MIAPNKDVPNAKCEEGFSMLYKITVPAIPKIIVNVVKIKTLNFLY